MLVSPVNVNLLVDMPAVRPGRLAGSLAARDLSAEVAAELVRAEADALPFFSFRLLADPPRCRLEVTGTGPAAAAARAMFREMAA